MSYTSIDLEKQPTAVVSPVSPPTMSPPMSPTTLSALASYQMLVGDIDKPLTAIDHSLYREIYLEERKATRLFYITAFLIYTSIALQVILCLGITVGAQQGLNMNQISVLAAVNTGVAATIGVLKGLGMPDKVALERRRLQVLIERIRVTTRKLRAGINVDASAEEADLRKTYSAAEEEAACQAAALSDATSGGLGALHNYKK